MATMQQAIDALNAAATAYNTGAAQIQQAIQQAQQSVNNYISSAKAGYPIINVLPANNTRLINAAGAFDGLTGCGLNAGVTVTEADRLSANGPEAQALVQAMMAGMPASWAPPDPAIADFAIAQIDVPANFAYPYAVFRHVPGTLAGFPRLTKSFWFRMVSGPTGVQNWGLLPNAVGGADPTDGQWHKIVAPSSQWGIHLPAVQGHATPVSYLIALPALFVGDVSVDVAPHIPPSFSYSY